MSSRSESLPEQFVIFDTEFTAWEGSQERDWSGPNEHREVIQIGAVKVRGMQEVDAFLCYVQPVKNQELSGYIQRLTGITQKEIDEKGVSYEEAQRAFHVWCDRLPMFSMSGGDGRVLEENSVLNDVDFPFWEEAHYSASAIFTAHGIDTRTYISSTIPKAVGLEPLADAHNALNDARSILLALQGLYTPERG